ncbi:senescence-associated E3 ubiquitin ligase 1, partial [Perilla frutescens var. frutescens]
ALLKPSYPWLPAILGGERDSGLTRQILYEGAFPLGETRRNRFMTPYLEGLVKVLASITFALSEESGAAPALCREYNLASLFIDLLQVNGLDNLQIVSAMALENLSQESKNFDTIARVSCSCILCLVFPSLKQATSDHRIVPSPIHAGYVH